LQSTNLITGQQQVALDFLRDAPSVEVKEQDGYFVLPSAEGGGFAGLQSSVNTLLDKVNTINFDQIGKDLQNLLQSTSALLSGPQMRETLNKLAATLASADTFTRNLNAGTAPAFKQLPEMTGQLQKTLNNTNKLLVSLDAGYGDNTKFSRDLDRLLVQTNDALSSLRALADLLSRHPEALIKGRPAGGVE
jgi:paraquat-inducible protein B